MVTNRKSKVSSTRISGDHEFTGVEITQALNANGFVGNSPSALYGQIDVMFNPEDQERTSNRFCFGVINNNFWLGK